MLFLNLTLDTYVDLQVYNTTPYVFLVDQS